MNEIITVPTRLDLIRMLPAGSTIAEVGVWRGYLSNEILSIPNFKHVWLIDSWRRRDDYTDPLADAATDHEANFQETKRNIRGHDGGGRYTIIRADSLDAAKQFADGSLTAVYLDGNHSYHAVSDDLRAWSRVVGPQGHILGHDHVESDQGRKWGFGVVRAVADFCEIYGWRIAALDQEEFQSFCLRKI